MRSPDSLCADQAGDAGQDGLTVIEKWGENTCQWAPSEGVFKDFGGFSSVPVVLPADRGSLTVTGGEAGHTNAAKRCQVLVLFFDLSQIGQIWSICSLAAAVYSIERQMWFAAGSKTSLCFVVLWVNKDLLRCSPSLEYCSPPAGPGGCKTCWIFKCGLYKSSHGGH